MILRMIALKYFIQKLKDKLFDEIYADEKVENKNSESMSNLKPPLFDQK